MNKLNVRRLALTYAGSFLGAGFVSGQEIWQFFGAFGLGGWVGLLLTVLLLIGVGLIIMLLVERTGILEMDRLMIPWDIPWLRVLSAVLQIIFYFGIISIMCAGGGALFHQLFGIAAPIGSAIICAFVTVVAISGAGGIVRVYSVIVPLMVAMAVAAGAWGLVRFGIQPTQTAESVNPLLGNWLLGCVTYTAYNSFATVGILAPVAEIPHTRKTTMWGITIAGIFLLFVACSVLGGVAAYPEAAESELPMLSLASALSSLFGYAYGVLLLLAMYGSALSCMVAVSNYAFKKKPTLAQKRIPLFVILGVVSYLTSLGGFGDLISVLYPLFGYASVVFLVCMTMHFFKTRKR